MLKRHVPAHAIATRPESREQSAERREHRAERREQRAESREQRAEIRDQGAESREQRKERRKKRAKRREQRMQRMQSRQKARGKKQQRSRGANQLALSDTALVSFRVASAMMYFLCWFWGWGLSVLAAGLAYAGFKVSNV
jgi:Flp pilus assembly protein TadB